MKEAILPLPCAMREKTEWCGDYLGISFNIVKWRGYSFESVLNLKWNWNFYLYINLEAIPDKADSYWLEPRIDRKRVHYDYSRHSVLASLPWHGGITYYSKESGFEGGPRIIKVGCDFMHSWDYEHGEYNLDLVLYEVKKTIENFRQLVPGYKYWCRWDGSLHDPKEVEVFPDGSYNCSQKCSEARKK